MKPSSAVIGALLAVSLLSGCSTTVAEEQKSAERDCSQAPTHEETLLSCVHELLLASPDEDLSPLTHKPLSITYERGSDKQRRIHETLKQLDEEGVQLRRKASGRADSNVYIDLIRVDTGEPVLSLSASGENNRYMLIGSPVSKVLLNWDQTELVPSVSNVSGGKGQ
ncbi:hypothetical protein ACUH94_08600 [Dermabacteraceae bacterium P7074]